MRPSLQSRILNLTLKSINFKKKVEKKAYKKYSKQNKKFVPKSIKRAYTTDIQNINSKSLATFEHTDKVTKNHIIFFHGGSYIFEISKMHWKLASKIVDKSFCRMTIIEYPLAPEFNYKQTFNLVHKAYDLLSKKYPDDNFILMGDSAGGGLVLAFTQKLIEEDHFKIPTKCILLSPWLDMTMSNPNIKNLEKRDYILSVEMLKYAGSKYSNGDNQDNYLLSPINGAFNKIPRTIIFYGTEELFYADCSKIKSIIGSENGKIILREYQSMQHDWALFPIPESDIVVEEISNFIDK